MKIGFVDHHLNNFHANKFLALLHGPLADLGARVGVAWESDPTGEDWCQKNGVPRAGSAAEVAEACDAVMVLAPDNIDKHMDLCGMVFPAGRPVLVDKFLAPDFEGARWITREAEKHGVRLFSASGLRFAVELEAALSQPGVAPTEAYARGMGEWDGYGVHTLSLAVGILGADIRRIIDTGAGPTACVTLEVHDGRRAHIDVRTAGNMWEALPWSFGFRTGDRFVTGAIQDFDGFYTSLMRRAVEFFTSGESPVSVEEMLRVVAALEAASRSRAAGGEWISL